MKKDSKRVLTLKQARSPMVADVIDRILDKGIVIEYRVNRVLLSGIDLLVTVDARYVVASLDTYLEYATPLRKARLLGDTEAWLHELTIP